MDGLPLAGAFLGHHCRINEAWVVAPIQAIQSIPTLNFVVLHENLRDMGYEAFVPARPHLGLQFVECQGPSSLFASSGLWVSKCPWLLLIAHWAIST